MWGFHYAIGFWWKRKVGPSGFQELDRAVLRPKL